MAGHAKEKFLVLMVDDSEDDGLLFKLALAKASRLRLIGQLENGEELVSYLSGEGNYADRQKHPLPDLLMLDLMMPRKNGFEVLEWLQQQVFKDMIVVVFSGSEHVKDIEKAKALGAHYYHTKEAGHEKRMALVRNLEGYLTGRGNAPA